MSVSFKIKMHKSWPNVFNLIVMKKIERNGERRFERIHIYMLNNNKSLLKQFVYTSESELSRVIYNNINIKFNI